jgi:crotonobetainyl-CoA:carnitine CoA-transferase CaiB-like acyl-CoA transferase
MHLLQAQGIAAGPVIGPLGAYADPHLRERGFFREVTHREAGTHLYPGMCFRYAGTPVDIRIPAPCLGEHNDYVYGKLLGMTDAEIAQLKAENTIGDAYLPEVP